MARETVKGRNRAGDALIAWMRKNGYGCWSACVLDGMMGDIYFDIEPPLPLWKGMNPHPINRAQVVASYIARDTRFEISRFHANDTAGRARVLRLYTLKEEFR